MGKEQQLLSDEDKEQLEYISQWKVRKNIRNRHLNMAKWYFKQAFIELADCFKLLLERG